MSHHEHVPRRLIALPSDVETFKRTVAYRDIVGFIMTLNESVKNAAVPDEYPESELHAPVIALVTWLDSLIAMVKPVPLEKSQPGRFGNVAFRTWLERAVAVSREFLHSKLGLSDAHADELQGYVDESFGNKTRIDYGTGHELNFVAFLCCLSKLGLLGITDAQVIVFHIFNRYLALMRELQLYFMLEPAGSRGVWGLDDFQFMPFLWGSSQLLSYILCLIGS
jgi:serine/threonine-protein phosphatase 2A activator